MLNDRERVALVGIERQLRSSDPELARLLARGRRRRISSPGLLLGLGVLVTILGSALMSTSVAILGMVIAALALHAAYRRSDVPQSIT